MQHFWISLAVGLGVTGLLLLLFLRLGHKSKSQVEEERELVKNCGDESLIKLYDQATTEAEKSDIVAFAKEKQREQDGPADMFAAGERGKRGRRNRNRRRSRELTPAAALPEVDRLDSFIEASLAHTEQETSVLPEMPKPEPPPVTLEDYITAQFAEMDGVAPRPADKPPGWIAEIAKSAAATMEQEPPAPAPPSEAADFWSDVAEQRAAVRSEPSPGAPLAQTPPESAPPLEPFPQTQLEQVPPEEPLVQMQPEQAPPLEPLMQAPPAQPDFWAEPEARDPAAFWAEPQAVPQQAGFYAEPQAMPAQAGFYAEPQVGQPQAEIYAEPVPFAAAEIVGGVPSGYPGNETVMPGLATVFAGSAMQGLAGEAAAEAQTEANISSGGYAPSPLQDEEQSAQTRALPLDKVDWSVVEEELQRKREEEARIMAQNIHIQEVFAKVKNVEGRILEEQNEVDQ